MSRRLAQFATAIAVGFALCGPAAHAQRGPGGPPGGSPGGPPGGGGHVGGPPGSTMMGSPSPRNESSIEPRSRGPQLGLPGRWWDDKHFVQRISIRSDQQQKMDGIFEANKTQLLGAYTNLQHEEQHLSAMSAADLKDENKVFASIDRVAQARAELEKENTHIVMQIRQQLDADQIAKLDKEIATTSR